MTKINNNSREKAFKIRITVFLSMSCSLKLVLLLLLYYTSVHFSLLSLESAIPLPHLGILQFPVSAIFDQIGGTWTWLIRVSKLLIWATLSCLKVIILFESHRLSFFPAWSNISQLRSLIKKKLCCIYFSTLFKFLIFFDSDNFWLCDCMTPSC